MKTLFRDPVLKSIAISLFCTLSLEGQNITSVSTRGNISVTKLSNGIVQIQNTRTGYSKLKTIEQTNIKTSVPTLVIDVRTIDTSLYSSKFHYLSSFKAGMETDDFELVAYDFNKNGKNEVILSNQDYRNPFAEQWGVGIYEMGSGSTMEKIYQFPDSLILGGLAYGDMNNDGKMEVVFQPTIKDSAFTFFYSQSANDQLPSKYFGQFDSAGPHERLRQPRLRNVDDDPDLELIYYTEHFPPYPLSGRFNEIVKYNTSKNKFEIAYSYKLPTYTAGFSFDDFDMDGKPNFATGSIDGSLFIYEHETGNNYSVIRIDSLPTKNAYLTAFTNDLDGNGKPELWIGGDFYDNEIGYTRLIAYEFVKDNQYAPVYQIDLKGVFSFYAGNIQIVDMDNDGKDEILLCIDQLVLIFKYQKPDYQLWYVKWNESALAGLNSVVYSAFAVDLDGDKKKDILMVKDILDPIKGLLVYSSIYKNDVATSVRSDNSVVPSGYELFQNYPNPFNNSTMIEFQLPKQSFVNITLYDVLGKEITTITKDIFDSGRHNVRWNGKNALGEEAASGMYIARLISPQYSKSIKILFQK